ncbi:hypothetical protein J6590_033331 [Homalodisca vitripennis]|nr:hypothetical protein J6590_033331 [Homalodisca vitripennis]
MLRLQISWLFCELDWRISGVRSALRSLRHYLHIDSTALLSPISDVSVQNRWALDQLATAYLIAAIPTAAGR